jgi:hypothetical protein
MSATAYTTELGDALLSVEGVLLRAGPRALQATSQRAPSVAVPTPIRPGAVRTFGARTTAQLRRDLAAERPVRRRVSLIGLTLRFEADTVAEHRETAVALVAEVAQQILRGEDRIYRTGPAELTLRLYDADDAGAEIAIIRLEARGRRLLAQHGLRSPAFESASVDPGVVIGAAASA